MPPGSTRRPLASMMCRASPRSCPSAVIVPCAMPTSQAKLSDAVATVPPRMMVSNVMSLSRGWSECLSLGGGRTIAVLDPRRELFGKPTGRLRCGPPERARDRLARRKRHQRLGLLDRRSDRIDERHRNALADLQRKAGKRRPAENDHLGL